MRLAQLFAGAALGAIALAACGSGGGSYGSGTTSTSPPLPTPAPTTARTADSTLGAVLVDGSGHTLYGRTVDVNGVPSCTEACANAWPPLIVEGTRLPAGLDAKIFSVVARPDGSHQLEAGTWPLYRFAGDAKPGDTNGQGSGGVFFVATPTGGLHKGA
jgi:predicted lipoprotein with Yx(FWY)xxD motif